MRLNKSTIDTLELPTKGQRLYRDDALKCFGVRVTTTGTKTFFVEKRIHGRKRRISIGRYGELTPEQARKEAQKFLGKVATGIDPVAEKQARDIKGITLGDVFEEYLSVRKTLTPGTVHDYRRQMRESFSDWVNRPLALISKDAVAKRHARIGQRSPHRANGAMRVLRALFNFAHGQYEDEHGGSLFPNNPVSRLSHTRAWYPSTRRQTLIKRSDLPSWFEAVNALRLQSEDTQARTVADYLLVLLFTGMRRSEGMNLQWDNIDLAAATLTVPTTKNGKALTLPLSDFLLELFKARRLLVEGPHVFPGSGEYGRLVEPRPQINKVIKQSGITFTLHDLRRTYITVAESLDISGYAIKRLANHSVGNDVTAGYIISDVERLRAPMQRITDFLLSVSGSRPPAEVISLRTSTPAVEQASNQ